MRIKKFLINNSIGIIGVVISLLGVLFAIFYNRQTDNIRNPVYYMSGMRPILDRDRVPVTPLKVIKRDGQEIRKKVYNMKVFFWNDGNQSIRKENILEKISLTLNDSTANFIDYEIKKISRDITEFKIIPDQEKPDKLIYIDFLILEKYDGASMQFIIESDKYTEIKFSGIIEGVKKISKVMENEGPFYSTHNFLSRFGLVIGVICTCCLFLISISFNKFFKQNESIISNFIYLKYLSFLSCTYKAFRIFLKK